FQTQQIMGRSQTMMSELVKNGELDPLDAQERAIRSAMSDFMSVGDYQAAQGLLPGLNQIRTYRAELGKLKAETYNQQASGFHQEAEGNATLAKAPHEISKLDSEALAQQSTAALNSEKMDTE